jgi:hypothetical protein
MATATYSGTLTNTAPISIELPGVPCGGVQWSASFTTTLGSNPIGAVGTTLSFSFCDLAQPSNARLQMSLNNQNTPGPGAGTFTGHISGDAVNNRGPTTGTTTYEQIFPDASFVPGAKFSWEVEGFFNALWAEVPYGNFGPVSINKPDGSTVTWDTLDTGTGFPGTIIDASAGNTINSFGYITITSTEEVESTYEISVATSNNTTESIILYDPDAVYGGPVILSGANLGPLATAMDYERDSNGTWTALSSFSGNGAFHGTTQDLYSYGVHSYVVRDHNNPSVVSNSVEYYLAPPVIPGVGTITVMFPMPIYLECVPCGPILLVGPGNKPVSGP